MKHTLVGSWRLAEWDCLIDDGYHSHPFGKNAVGLLIYAADGGMSAVLMRRERQNFKGGNLVKGSAAEKLAAVEGYVSYAGRYQVEGDRVIHAVEMSLLPNWIGGRLVRELEWLDPRGDEMTLSTVPVRTRSGRAVVNRLRWSRVT